MSYNITIIIIRLSIQMYFNAFYYFFENTFSYPLILYLYLVSKGFFERIILQSNNMFLCYLIYISFYLGFPFMYR